MANQTLPYDGPLGKTIDVDPDDVNFVVWDVSKDLNDRQTTAASVVLIATNVAADQGPTIQGMAIIALIRMTSPDKALVHSATARITCANGERFDRTIYFSLEDH